MALSGFLRQALDTEAASRPASVDGSTPVPRPLRAPAPTATSRWSWCATPSTARWPPRAGSGEGEKESADGAAVDAMRLMLDTVTMDGIVVIGEGEKDEAPMLYNGEQIGDGSPPQVDIAVDPLEGTELTAKGFRTRWP